MITISRCRERDFLKKIHESLEKDGKVMSAHYYYYNTLHSIYIICNSPPTVTGQSVTTV